MDEAQLHETLGRRRREPSYRPIVLVENASQEQVIAVRARGMGVARHRVSGGAGAEVSGQ